MCAQHMRFTKSLLTLIELYEEQRRCVRRGAS